MAATIQCEIVSTEKELFSGKLEMLIAAGELGDLGILPGHAPLLTKLVAGPVRLLFPGGKEEVFYVSGGMMEVQPKLITVLADSAARAEDVDHAAAEKARAEALAALSDQKSDIDYSTVAAQLAESAAQIRTLQQLKKKYGKS